MATWLKKYKYPLTILFFGAWISFFDETNLLYHSKLKRDIAKLEQQIEQYKEENASQKEYLENLRHSTETREKLAREMYFMSKEGEDVFIFEENEK